MRLRQPAVEILGVESDSSSPARTATGQATARTALPLSRNGTHAMVAEGGPASSVADGELWRFFTELTRRRGFIHSCCRDTGRKVSGNSARLAIESGKSRGVTVDYSTASMADAFDRQCQLFDRFPRRRTWLVAILDS